MSSTLIQQSLIDIEQNLKKLDSARNQVGTLADKSEQLITSIASVIESIENIKKSFIDDENYLKNSLDKTITEFKSTVAAGAESVISTSSKIVEEHSSNFIRSLDKFNYSLKEGIENTIVKTDEIYSKQETIITKNLATVNTMFDEASNKIIKESQLFKDNHKSISNQTIEKLNELQITISESQSSLEKFDFKKSLSNINSEIQSLKELTNSSQTTFTNEFIDLKSKFEEVIKQQKKSSNLNLIVLASGFILTIIILIAK